MILKASSCLSLKSCLSVSILCQSCWGFIFCFHRDSYWVILNHSWLHMQGCPRVWYPKQCGPFNWKMLPEQGKKPCSVFGDNFLFIHHHWAVNVYKILCLIHMPFLTPPPFSLPLGWCAGGYIHTALQQFPCYFLLAHSACLAQISADTSVLSEQVRKVGIESRGFWLVKTIPSLKMEQRVTSPGRGCAKAWGGFLLYRITENYTWCISSWSLWWCQGCFFPEVRI